MGTAVVLAFFDVLDPIELDPTSSTCELRKRLRIDSDETSDRKEEPRSDGHPNFFIMVRKVYRTDGTDQKVFRLTFYHTGSFALSAV